LSLDWENKVIINLVEALNRVLEGEVCDRVRGVLGWLQVWLRAGAERVGSLFW